MNVISNFIKQVNYALIEYQKKKKTSLVLGYPYWLTVDPSNICNLHCPCCPTGQQRGTRSQTQMSFDSFKKVMDKLGKYLLHIDFCNWGEPLLNRDIAKMAKYAKKYAPSMKVDTNLNVDMTPEFAEELITSGLDRITMSVDGASQETYEKYRRAGNYAKAIENMKLLVETKKRFKGSGPHLHWQFLVFKHNEHELEKAKELSKKIGVDSIGFTAPFCPVEMASTIEEFNKYKGKKEDTPIYKKLEEICNWPWDAITINADGSISPCCSVEDQKDDFDNYFKKPFWMIWNGKKYRQARKHIASRRGGFKDNVCVKCDHIGASNHAGIRPAQKR